MDPQIRFETVTGTTFVRLLNETDDFNIELFRLSDQPHDQARFKRRMRRDYGDFRASILTAEDVLITKLHWLHRYGRAKDQLDAENVMATNWETLDWPYVKSWAERMDFILTFEKVRVLIAARLACPPPHRVTTSGDNG